MKKITIFTFIVALALPLVSHASFDYSLSYGTSGQSVFELQELLNSEGCFNHESTGNFYSLTLAGVKCFQAKYNIPTTGYFGVLSRAQANAIIDSMTADSSAEQEQDTSMQAPAPSEAAVAPTQSAPVVASAPIAPVVALSRQCLVSEKAFGSVAPQAAYIITVDGKDTAYGYYTLKATITHANGDPVSNWNYTGDQGSYVKGIAYLGQGDLAQYDINVYDQKGGTLIGRITGNLTFDANCSVN